MHRRLFFLFLLLIFLLPQVSLASSLSTNIPSTKSPAASEKNDPILPANETSSPQAELANVRWTVKPDSVTGNSSLRVVIDTTGPVKVSSRLDDTNSQIILDIAGASVGSMNDRLPLDGTFADQASLTAMANNNSKVIINLAGVINDGDYTVFTLPSDSANNKMFRIVIDINKPLPNIDYNFTPGLGLQNKVIVIDPGHGGSDSGAVGPNSTMEKTITLAVAQKVQALLEKAGAQVIMTRQTDKDVYAPNDSAVDELKARTQFASTNHADVFLSIHINAFSNPDVGGTATYYYPKSKYDILLAQSIQSNLVAADGLEDRGRHPARFYVLRNTTMPSVLTELAFISNPNEEKLINTLPFQQHAAEGIVRGLGVFFAQATQKEGD